MDEDEKEMTVTATEFQRSVGAMIDMIRVKKHHVTVTAHGRPQIVVVPVEEYRAMKESQSELTRLRVRFLGRG